MARKVVDLSLTLSDGMMTSPFLEKPTPPKMTIMDRVTHEYTAPWYKPPCRGNCNKLILCSDHHGTHVDAPYHFYPEKETIERVPVEKYFGDAVLVDVSSKRYDEFITRDLIEKTLKRQGVNINQEEIAVLRAWPGKWGDAKEFFTCKGVSLDAAEWLRNVPVKAVGIDLPGIDWVREPTRPGHMTFLGAGIPIFEDLVNLEKIGKWRFWFAGLPLKLEGCTGSPVRAIALVDG